MENVHAGGHHGKNQIPWEFVLTALLMDVHHAKFIKVMSATGVSMTKQLLKMENATVLKEQQEIMMECVKHAM